jgi:RNA ligase
MNTIDIKKIESLIEEGFIRKNKHPSFDLYIYNYTAKTQYENYWIPETLQCRGVITNSEGEIIARPFTKFFNIEQMSETLLTDSFKVFEKLDGSLGILYFHHNIPYIATRGSFVGEQAIEANNMLHTIYKNSTHLLDKNFTYLFEIIYPKNRVVVNYGDTKSLTLLAVIETESGKDLPLNNFNNLGFPIAKEYNHLKQIEHIVSLNEINKEGFVLLFDNGVRAKFKFEQYVKFHSLITEMTSKKIWELVKGDISFDQFIDKIPDELFKWVQDKIQFFKDEYNRIEQKAEISFKRIMELVPSKERKELAKHIVQHEYPQILFAKLDNKDISKYIWKILEPPHEIPTFSSLLFQDAE